VRPTAGALRAVATSQARPQLRDLLVGARSRGQPGAFDLQGAPDLQDFAQFRPAQPADRPGHFAGGAHVGAVALPDLEDPGVRERAHGLADGVAPDAELLDELGLGGDAFADRPFALRDRRPPMLAEMRADLGASVLWAGVLTTLPTLCFAGAGLAAPLLARRAGIGAAIAIALAALAAGLVLRVLDGPAVVLGGTLVATAGIAL